MTAIPSASPTSPATISAPPIQVIEGAVTPASTAATIPALPSAGITTTAHSPAPGSQVRVCSPVPLICCVQKPWLPGVPTGAPPSCSV